MTDSATSLMAILFGLAVFSVIVAVGWRSVQNRRILRLQGAGDEETIIIAGEDDEVSSIVTSTEVNDKRSSRSGQIR
jgi:hypothetical protein